MTRRAAAVVVVLFAGALVLLLVPRAGAHALLVRSQPADGESLPWSPSSIRLTFSEAPDPGLSDVDVLDTSGGPHALPASPEPADARMLVRKVEPLRDGVYTVSWRVVSRVDGHLTAGSFAFGIGVAPSEIEDADTTTAAAPTLSGAEVAGRVLLYVGLIMLVGGAWIFRFAFASSPRRSRTFMLSAALFAIAGIGVFTVAQTQATGAPLDRLLGTSLGSALLARSIGIGVAVLAVVAGALDERRRRGWWDAAGVAAAATIFVHATAGHAAAGGVIWFKVVEQFVHITAVGVWIGGLAALIAGMSSVGAEERLTAVRRFSTVAGVALVVVAGSGLGRAYQEVGSWSALFSTGYGRVVIGKVAGIGALALLGALNRYRNVRRAGDEPVSLARTARVELATSVAVLVLAASLASLAPAKSSSAEPSQSVVVEGSDFTKEVSVRLEITPGGAGVNNFRVGLDVEDGAAVRGVTLRLAPADGDVEPSRVELKRSGGGWIAKGSALATPGRWRVVVVIDRGADSVEVPLAFHTVCPKPTTQETGDLRLHTIDLGAGGVRGESPRAGSVQAYVDPGRTGNNEVHFTLFDDRGAELALSDDARVTAARGDRVAELDERKLSPGHFVAGGRLQAGEWVFDFDGETKDGDAVNVCFEEVIR